MTHLQVPATPKGDIAVTPEPGRALYMLGPNGAGKSTLLFRWAKQRETATLVAGNRSVIFGSAAVTLSPNEMNRRTKNAGHYLRQGKGRAEKNPLNNEDALNVLLGRLKARGEHAYRVHFEADGKGDEDRKARIRDTLPDIRINNALAAAGLSIQLAWNQKSELMVTKSGIATQYGIDKMSDGERAALILAASAILADPDSLILMDEPERHLHRAISSPLLECLRHDRPDLAWVIATHDLSLARDDPTGAILLLYAYDGDRWTADLAADLSTVPAEVAEAIYGARERVLFVEGEDHKLDKPLYSIFFPSITILAARSCKDVQNAVRGLTQTDAVHHMTARGLVDRDNRVDRDALSADGVATIDAYAVESIYYHSTVIDAVRPLAGADVSLDDVLAEACNCISEDDCKRFASDAAYTAFRRAFFAAVPSKAEFAQRGGRVAVDLPDDLPTVDRTQHQLIVLRDSRHWDELAVRIKVKDSQAPARIARRLGYANADAYEGAARKALKSRPDSVEALRTIVPDPFGG